MDYLWGYAENQLVYSYIAFVLRTEGNNQGELFYRALFYHAENNRVLKQRRLIGPSVANSWLMLKKAFRLDLDCELLYFLICLQFFNCFLISHFFEFVCYPLEGLGV